MTIKQIIGFTCAVPFVGFNNVESIESVVVLPSPFDHKNLNTFPFSIIKLN